MSEPRTQAEQDAEVRRMNRDALQSIYERKARDEAEAERKRGPLPSKPVERRPSLAPRCSEAERKHEPEAEASREWSTVTLSAESWSAVRDLKAAFRGLADVIQTEVEEAAEEGSEERVLDADRLRALALLADRGRKALAKIGPEASRG
ncbi:MAG: hypothetical protein JNK60_14140 [Acidobacteria bacterium]|nr:hypothetical protein [Acidobacteriota bacterium]